MPKHQHIPISGAKTEMKIDDLNQKSAVAHLASGRADKPESAEVHGDASAKLHAGSDKVELSSYMPVVPASKSLQDQQSLRVNRVEEVKSQIASGTYQVSSHDVAEKMLSKIVLGSSN
jgi:negative regulator of flagellin synthesis FlgM